MPAVNTMETGSNCGSTGQLSTSGSTGASMHHSLSTPAGVDGGARTPPATPKKGGKMLAIRVQMLDDTTTIFQVQAKALGSVLFEQVCKQLHLLEADYFGLEYADVGGTKYWLDLQKPVSRQLGLSLVDPLLYFCVKFYTPDPGQLEEEYTRYLFCLQVKRDLAQGLMQCNENTAALMASYIVQAECGDYVSEDYPDHTYLSTYKFVPQQDQEMERKIMENHKKHAGQSPAEADLNLLETARRCELYGMKMHPAKDHENVPLNLAVAHMGILVFQNYTKINTFSWAKIRKISFKRKRFLIKLHPEGYGYYKDTVEFFFEGRNECKNFWKKCVENHGFFRCSSVKNISRHKTRVLSRGSSFRYSGKTQKQMVEFVRDNYVKRQTFQRSASFRQSSAHSSATNMHSSTVGNSISAHPLLPLADTNLSVEASKLSASLGSMGVTARGPGSPTTKSVCHPRGRATCWSSEPDTRPTTLLAQTTTSPSPPLTTQSASPVTSATTSPQRTPYVDQKPPYVSSSPVAVHAAVHRADTGITIHTHITSVRMPSSHKSEGSLDQIYPFTNKYPSQTQSQNDLGLRSVSGQPAQNSSEYTHKSVTSLPKRHIWQRSASCRDLYDFSFEDSGQAKHRNKPAKPVERIIASFDDRKLESPVTRYDDHRPIYDSTSHDDSLEIHQDIMMPDQKVYSSSYPGTTSYSQDSVEDPGNYDLRDSQDDLSHDSYELIERSDDDYSTSGEYNKYQQHKTKILNTRSCSLDSGNYLPSDTDSDGDKRHKCKSSSDVHEDLFMMDDPRDFPREIIPRKSDGNYYKTIKDASRTSSLESKSDYYESKSKSSKESLKKSSKRSLDSRTSSQESKSGEYSMKKSIRKNKSVENLGKRNELIDSRTSSLESKSEYYDANSKIDDNLKQTQNYQENYDRKITFERNYGTQKQPPKQQHNYVFEANNYFPPIKETSHVHSISLQNVETEQNIRVNRMLASLDQNTLPRTQKSNQNQRVPHSANADSRRTTYIWPQSIPGLPTEIRDWPTKQSTDRSTESESNIFSFDEDKIQSLQESSDIDGTIDNTFSVVPNIDNTKNTDVACKNSYKNKFMEIETRKYHEPLPLHQPIERTKSDPNSLARQRINSSNRRLLLMHQKSFDLTPAESSDEDYLYKQIPPSAPPIMKYRGTHFEMPAAEFGHFDILKREIEGQKTKFEVPKSQFEVLGAKTQSDFINLPPKTEDLSYVLHKRHIMNGTASVDEVVQPEKNDLPDVTRSYSKDSTITENEKLTKQILPPPPKGDTQFLFTSNIDLSKVDPVTLEVDKTEPPIKLVSSPKRDITHIDPILLEALNSKLSQIESDSPTSSKTESLHPHQVALNLQKEKQNKNEVKQRMDQAIQKSEEKKLEDKQDINIKGKNKIKTDIKPKRIIKPRMQPGKKGGKTNKTKVRITSFSSDDESLDSDDVFGSAEATPTRMEFSPPQMRKEMESILKFESERKYLQYTMSSTEVEGSPPQSRKKIDKNQYDGLDVNVQTELRRISERSISIPSSEDDLNVGVTDLQPVFAEPTSTLLIDEVDKDDKSIDETLREEVTVEEVYIDKKCELDAENKREKELLQAEIENDLKDLKVPLKTKITEVSSPLLRKKGQLFAHARLNLSEGSAFTLIQKQKALDSPISGRRAKSLDAPIIPVSRLPPLNAFSSKDDTMEDEDDISRKSNELPQTIKEEITIKKSATEGALKKIDTQRLLEKVKSESKLKIKERDQIVPDVGSRTAKKGATTVKTNVQNKSYAQKAAKHRAAAKEIVKQSSKEKIPPKVPKLISTNNKPAVPTRTTSIGIKTETPPEIILRNGRELPTQLSLTLPEIKRTKSQEIDQSTKQVLPKEKAKSLEKLEFKRVGSRERTKSQDESDTDVAKRKEKQQMLYEIAIKQTKTLKSPVKDVLPVFPQVEEMVRERHGKLEISINTIENNSIPLEEAIIITKSPKKLDKKMDKKLTKSLELNLNDDEETETGKISRLGKSLDLENRPMKESAQIEFDFKTETIASFNFSRQPDDNDNRPPDLISSINLENETEHDEVILEGTSLDVWLSVDQQPKEDPITDEKLNEDIKVIKKSNDFFDEGKFSKPPDLCKIETKSSSESQSIEKVSLGNALDIKYIDDSGDSSHKSEQDNQLMLEMQKASATVSKFIKRKLDRQRLENVIKSEASENLVRITSEDESLTEVSELKCEPQEVDNNLLQVDERMNLLQKISERSRSEDTASWMTVECEEYAGAETSFEYDNAPLDSPELESHEDDDKTLKMTEQPEVKVFEEPNPSNFLQTSDSKQKLNLLKRSSDQSRSSDTTGSWTSGEKELSPSNIKDEESSLSCSMGRVIGLSQTIEKFASRELMEKASVESDAPKSPRSPRICVLGRAFTIDEDSTSIKLDKSGGESSSDEAQNIPKDTPTQSGILYKKIPYPFEEKWSDDSELTQRLHQKISKKLSSAEKGSMSSVDDSLSSDKIKGAKGSLYSIEKLSTESKNSIDTESSSGSFGVAMRAQKSGDIPKELSSTWKAFPLDSSGSESFDDGLLPPDQDLNRQEYFLCRDDSGNFQSLSDVYKSEEITPTRDDTELPEDLANFPANFGYPCLTSDMGGIGLSISSNDIIPNYTAGGGFLSRTLSRISERSTNSEKSSLEEDYTKASTQSDSLNDESLASSNPQVSLSSDPPSHAQVFSENDKKSNGFGQLPKKESKRSESKPSSEQIPNINNLLQRQISDDRRTSAEMADLSMDDIEIITSERGLKLKRQNSDDTIIDEECLEEVEGNGENEKKGSSSQESDEWPLPEIPQQQGQKNLLALHEVPSSDTSQQTTQVFQPPRVNIPKTFGLRGSIKSQDSEQWPSPPSSVIEPITGNVETFYMTPPEEPCKELVDSNTTNSMDNEDSNSEDDNENKTLELDTEKTHTYENVATEHISESISESLSVGISGVKIILDKKSNGSNSDEDLNLSNLNDDVFVDNIESKNELRPPTVMRRSTTSDDSSHSGCNKNLKPSTSSQKGSHSSYSEEECTSSMGTNLEDGTVRYALKPTKCTHSSHSEDTSIALSLSEWSNSTNTVKFQNLSSNSGTTKSSSGLKSDDNSLTDIAISEWSSSNSTFKTQQSAAATNLQFQKLSSNTSTGDSTLTDLIPTISEWSSSDSKTLVPHPQLFNTNLTERQSVTRLGSSIEEGDIGLISLDKINIPSPKNIPSEDLALLPRLDNNKHYTKSTERPILIPIQPAHSDTERSSSSVEHKTVYSQRYDTNKQKYLKHQTSSSCKSSTERPVKVPLKLSKCSPYYSSSLSSESTPLASTSPIPNKTATVPLTRTHRKPVCKSLFQAKSPPSENDSTSSVESPKSKSDRERRGYRRRRQSQTQRRHSKPEKEQPPHHCVDEYFYVEHEDGLTEYNEYLRSRNLEEMAAYQYECALASNEGLRYAENLEEGYYPDGDSQSGSDIFRMEKDDDDHYEIVEGFDVSSIPPPLLEDDLEGDQALNI